MHFKGQRGAAFPEVREALLAKPKSEAICVTLDRVAKEKEECVRQIQQAFSVPSWKLEYEPAADRVPAAVTLVQGSRKVALSTLLAPGFSFKAVDPNRRRSYMGQAEFNVVDTAVCDHDSKTVTVSPYDLHLPGALPVGLHEAGHTHQKAPEEPVMNWGQRKILNTQWWMNFLLNFTMRREIRRSCGIVAVPVRGAGTAYLPDIRLPPEAFYPKPHIEEHHRDGAESERDAWRRAVESMRALEAQGIDVWEAFPGDTFVDFIDFALQSYDDVRYTELYVHGGCKAVESAEPVYLRKRGEFGRQPVTE